MSRFAVLCLPLLFLFPLFSPAQATASSRQEAAEHIRISQQYLREQRPDLAIPELQKAVALDPENVDARGNLGVLLFFRGDYAGAIPELRVAVKRRPDLWKLQGLLGLAEGSAGDIDASRADLEAAFPHLTEPKFKVQVGNALVSSYTSTGDTEKAAAVVSQLLADDPTNQQLLYSAYRLYSDLTDKALVTMALTAPDSALMHEMMARVVTRQGNDAQAITDLQEALKINPHLPDAHRELGELYSHSTDEKLQAQAMPEFHAALAENPNDEKAHLLLGEAAAKAGDTQTAFAEDSAAVKLQAGDVDALVSLGKVLMSMNRHDQAQAMFERALKADPTNTVAHYRLSMIYRREGRTADAAQQMTAYRKYKDMQAKLEKIFHDLRVGPLQNGTDDSDADGQDAAH